MSRGRYPSGFSVWLACSTIYYSILPLLSGFNLYALQNTLSSRYILHLCRATKYTRNFRNDLNLQDLNTYLE